jgi:hypothetical protein
VTPSEEGEIVRGLLCRHPPLGLISTNTPRHVARATGAGASGCGGPTEGGPNVEGRPRRVAARACALWSAATTSRRDIAKSVSLTPV